MHPTAVLICPFIASVANTGFGDFQWKSPFHSCPSTLSALSLTNLQVGVGGQNVFNSTLNMTYEFFLQQVNLAEQLKSSDFGVSTGLISQGYWEASKLYFVNVERGNIAGIHIPQYKEEYKFKKKIRRSKRQRNFCLFYFASQES